MIPTVMVNIVEVLLIDLNLFNPDFFFVPNGKMKIGASNLT